MCLMLDNQLEGEFQSRLGSLDIRHEDTLEMLESRYRQARKNLSWLYENMPRYFFITMGRESEAITNLVLGMQDLKNQHKMILTDQARKLIVARLDAPGSLYDTLVSLQGRDISYAEITHSARPVLDTAQNLEVLRFEFERKSRLEVAGTRRARIPGQTREAVLAAMKGLYPGFCFKEFDKYLNLLWLNNDAYVRWSPPERVARILWLYQQGLQHEGLFLDVEKTGQVMKPQEFRVLFSVENPPQQGFLTQAMEVFKRLNIGVRRAYSLHISNGIHWYFLGNFYVSPYGGQALTRDSGLFARLRTELYNTQILAAEDGAYRAFVSSGLMNGADASLANAMASFCQTTLAHTQPDRFSLEAVKDALLGHPDIIMMLIDLFRKRFDPELEGRDEAYDRALAETSRAIADHNTGYKHLDEIRRTIYKTCLLMVTRTLKTNFFIPEKHALAFRLDPAYLSELGPEFTADLPDRKPFRITFCYGRRGAGYHVGFSDIARGGWRTIICRSTDELTNNTNTLFREVVVLAHTQHLKNKDIYEGGSKMAVILDVRELGSPQAVVQQLYKVQFAFINALLDLLVTENGRAKDPRVVDYYGEEEPLELGPDENMHDTMIEVIARQAVKRGYLLGAGIMSSKRVGINHKQYGVTSRGVLRSAMIAMRQVGMDIHNHPFAVKLTGGPTGDVAGNALRLLLEQCPQARINGIIDASGALCDPLGADHEELTRLILKDDICRFNPEKLHPGGFLLFSENTRQESIKRLYRKVARSASGIEETWNTADEFHRELDDLLFTLPVDLFLPCGGRPETIDAQNWSRFFTDQGKPCARVIVEGANSFLAPEARVSLQKGGVIILRDASANKCGVITSSYEIIANLLMTDKEFLKHKETYVKDVLSILDRRVQDEANLIFARHRQAEGKQLYTDISAAISEEINELYDRLFLHFQRQAANLNQPLFFNVLLHHLPAMVQEHPKYRDRVKILPTKIKCAILASEIASAIVYGGGWEDDFEGKLLRFLQLRFE